MWGGRGKYPLGKNEKRKSKTEENYIKNGGKGLKNVSFWVIWGMAQFIVINIFTLGSKLRRVFQFFSSIMFGNTGTVLLRRKKRFLEASK